MQHFGIFVIFVAPKLKKLDADLGVGVHMLHFGVEILNFMILGIQSKREKRCKKLWYSRMDNEENLETDENVILKLEE